MIQYTYISEDLIQVIKIKSTFEEKKTCHLEVYPLDSAFAGNSKLILLFLAAFGVLGVIEVFIAILSSMFST